MMDPLLHLDATIGFQNPYGYLPGLLYGLFPFNGVLSLMYIVLGIYFLALITRHRQRVVAVHYFLLVVLLLATSESVACGGVGGWIFVSLDLTRKNLVAFGHTAPSRMHESLCRVLLSYVIISFMLMAFEGAIYSGVLEYICGGQ
ncbi:unnamed protein product [Peronospora belbahrii]|uniref:Uncharacterized protein n=1 Tax=Peronospora belbahrii TaxID=622444 RepID=A0ABN8DCK5_9STRA|nr:unnamed protein product [Peronospora belbahrii]